MFFRRYFKKLKKENKIQQEYVDAIRTIINSPLWDGTEEQIRQSLPKDLTSETIKYVKEL